MRVIRDGSARDDLATLFGAGALGRLGDAELLERFASGRGDAAARAAFAVLVERHGPMVRGVCLRALGDGHAADDAFQAIFLVLARKAGSVRVDDTLGRWLFGVSVRIARRARDRSRDVRRRERGLDGFEPPDRASPPDSIHLVELRAALDEEVARLPPRYRSVVVLCDVEGLTQEQAARLLRCPLGTVQSRLHRARERLRARLTRRGLAPSAGLAVALPRGGPRGAIPPALAGATTHAALRYASRSAAGAVPAAVVALAEEVSRAMFLSRLQIVVASALAVGIVTSGAVLAALQGEGNEASPRIVPGRGNAAIDLSGEWEVLYLSGTASDVRRGFVRPNLSVPITREAVNLPYLTGRSDDPINYRGESRYILEPNGDPGAIDLTAGAESGAPITLRGIYQLKGDILAICYGESAEGRPETFADTEASENLILLRRTPSETLMPAHPSTLPNPPLPTGAPRADREGRGEAPEDAPRLQDEARRSMTIQVVDAEGEPLEGVHLFRNHVYRVEGIERHRIENTEYWTDAEGKAVVGLSGISVDLRLWARRTGFVPLHAMWAREFQSDGDQIPGAFTFRLEPGTEIGGIVVDERGEPIEGVKVEVMDQTASSFHSVPAVKGPGRRPIRDMYLAEGKSAVFTDARGRWSLGNVPPDERLVFGDNANFAELFSDLLAPPRSRPELALRLTHPDFRSDEVSWGTHQRQQAITPGSLRDQTARIVLDRK